MADDFQAIFDAIRPSYARHAGTLIVQRDTPVCYHLTSDMMRKDGYRLWFGGVEIRKNYVSAHLMAVYASPTLLASVSEPLRKRMQGKSCFNFKTIDPALFAELDTLVDRAATRWAAPDFAISGFARQ